MNSFAAFIKQWTLPIAIAAGITGHSFFSRFAPLSIWLLMIMLFLTFSSLKPRDLGVHRLHFMLLAVQIGGSLISWFILAPLNPVLAQSVSLCFLIPTATAAPTITGMLGGNVGFLTAYLFLGNFAVILAAPLIIPLISQHHEGLPFFEFMARVFYKVTPTLLLPLLLAWGLRLLAPSVSAAIVKKSHVSYYLWAAMILILISSTFDTLFSPGQKSIALELSVSASGIGVCIVLFVIGRGAGRKYRRHIAAGQALAQKNLLFGMWLVFQYLDPAVLISLTAYSIFQNLFNTWQIWRMEKGYAFMRRRLRERHACQTSPVKSTAGER
ncbi:MAG: symporter [Mailhella sp.]|nr:symporter [Mailhella sp.]